MSIWREVGAELEKNLTPEGPPNFDLVRRRILTELSQHVERPVLIYAVDFMSSQKVRAAGNDLSIDLSDKEGFNEITLDLPHGPLDVVLHSPGGLAEAAESLVALLRNKFGPIRFIIPNIAKSAATMLALSGDAILMDHNAELGPIDPQFFISKGDGSTVVAPAQAIKDQFKLASDLIAKNPKNLAVWLPIIQQYGPSLLIQADNAMALSRELVTRWLTEFMFAKDPEAGLKAKGIADYFSDHNLFKTHSRRIGLREIQANKLPLNIIDLEEDHKLHRHVLRLYAALSHTFSATGVFKMYENSQGQALFKNLQFFIQSGPGVPTHPPALGGKKK